MQVAVVEEEDEVETRSVRYLPIFSVSFYRILMRDEDVISDAGKWVPREFAIY